MRIDAGNGCVTFEGGAVAADMTRTSFLDSPLGRVAQRWSANGEFESYRLVPEDGTIATVDFEGEILRMVSVVFEMPGEPQEGPTMEWEMKRKDRHDAWLGANLGAPPYEYAWGKVVSEFYHQHCASELSVVYAQPPRAAAE